MHLSRRELLVVGAGLVALATCQRSTALADPAEPVAPIGDRIEALEQRYQAHVGLYGVDLESVRAVAHRDGDPFALCSTFKTYAAARVLQRAQRGELQLSDTAFVDPAGIVANSPVTEPLAGTEVPLSALCVAALQRSDNTAANLLLKAIGGPAAITEFARSIGDDKTRLDRWETELNSALPGDPRDTSTPRALGDGYRELLIGDVLDEPHRSQLKTWMCGNQTSMRSLRAGLPDGWTSADKTGSCDFGSTNAVGLAYGPDGRTVLLSILTRTQSQDPEAENMPQLVAEVAALVVPWLTAPQ